MCPARPPHPPPLARGPLSGLLETSKSWNFSSGYVTSLTSDSPQPGLETLSLQPRLPLARPYQPHSHAPWRQAKKTPNLSQMPSQPLIQPKMHRYINLHHIEHASACKVTPHDITPGQFMTWPATTVWHIQTRPGIGPTERSPLAGEADGADWASPGFLRWFLAQPVLLPVGPPLVPPAVPASSAALPASGGLLGTPGPGH